MFPLNRQNNSLTYSSSINIISTSSIYHLLNNNKQLKRQQLLTTTITTTSLFSNITSLSSSTSTTQHQQISFEEPYSAKTGIKIAALLGGMLILVVVYVLWKARSRLCCFTRFSSSTMGTKRLSGNKFDLDYWLKQVDLLEAREVERNREWQSPYLELPHEQPRNNQVATASWIVDAWRQWRLIQYRQQHQSLQREINHQTELNPISYQRRRHTLRRFFRRLLISSHQRPSFLIEYAPSIIADMRPSIVNNNIIPPPDILDVQPRRVASWPRLKSTQHQNGTMMSALQTQNARKRLLERTSRTTTTTTFDI